MAPVRGDFTLRTNGKNNNDETLFIGPLNTNSPIFKKRQLCFLHSSTNQAPITSVHTGRVVASLFTVSLGLTCGVLIGIRPLAQSRRRALLILQDARPTF